MSDLAILVPVLRRPHRVAPLLEAIKATQTVPTRVVFITDPDDETERHAVIPNLQRAGNPLLWVDMLDCAGNYAQKINAGLEHTNEPVTNRGSREAPLIFLAADDLEPQATWFEAASRRLAMGADVVGVNDLIERQRDHQTHFLVTRDYAERGQLDGSPGLLCEVYEHNFVDDELIATAKSRGVYAYAEDAHVLHLHPMNGRSEMDDTYERGLSSLRRDRRIFRRREAAWA